MYKICQSDLNIFYILFSLTVLTLDEIPNGLYDNIVMGFMLATVYLSINSNLSVPSS